MKVLLVDMSTLSYRLDRARREIAVSAPGLPGLCTAGVPADVTEREAVFVGLDETLRSGRVPVGSGWARVALCNPLTDEVAIGPLPDTATHSDGEMLSIPATGLLCSVGSGMLVLPDGRALGRVVPSYASVSRAIAAHRS